MNILLMATMTLAVVFMLGVNQPVDAVATQPIASIYHQDQIIPAYWHRGYRDYDDGPYYYYGDPYYYRGPGFHFHLGF